VDVAAEAGQKAVVAGQLGGEPLHIGGKEAALAGVEGDEAHAAVPEGIGEACPSQPLTPLTDEPAIRIYLEGVGPAARPSPIAAPQPQVRLDHTA